MFGAAAVRNKKRKSGSQAPAPRGPYIKPFGPRFDPSELPYFKYKRALAEAKELQQNISRAKKARAASIAKGAGVAVRQQVALDSTAANVCDGADGNGATKTDGRANGNGHSVEPAAAGDSIPMPRPDFIKGRLKVRRTKETPQNPHP